jgi:hypothetical protein
MPFFCAFICEKHALWHGGALPAAAGPLSGLPMHVFSVQRVLNGTIQLLKGIDGLLIPAVLEFIS